MLLDLLNAGERDDGTFTGHRQFFGYTASVILRCSVVTTGLLKANKAGVIFSHGLMDLNFSHYFTQAFLLFYITSPNFQVTFLCKPLKL